MTYVHCNGDNHEFYVEAHEWLVLCESDLVDKADLDDAEEVPVETGVDDEDQHLGDLVPDVVYLDECFAGWWDCVRWDPDDEDGDVDCGDDDDGAPFYVAYYLSVFGDEGDPVDDDLHE